VRLWQQRERFRAGAAFRPWVLAIAVNLARNRLRWWRRRPTVALEEWTEQEAAGGGVPDGAADARAGGPQGLEAAERAAAPAPRP
jgi:RNA polymerase sigma-70 factor (ECF subfamily)